MISVKVKFRPSSIPGKEGRIYFQVSKKGVSRYVKTSHSILPTEWDKTTGRISSEGLSEERCLHLASVQAAIDRDMRRLMRIIARSSYDGTYDLEKIVELYHASRSQSFIVFMKRTIKHMQEMNMEGTSEAYAYALNSLNTFLHGNDIPIDGITEEFVKKYETWLKERKISLNTISFYMRILRATYNRAVENKLTNQAYPFKHVYVGVAKTTKRAIASQAIKKIKQLEISPKSTLDLARDIFLFSFYTRGMSFVDIAYLRQSNLCNGTLTYHRRKTGQRIRVKWERCMQDIVNKHHTPGSPFLLPLIHHENGDVRKQYRNALHLINYKLKRISAMAGLPIRLSMYVARHSWASIAKNKRIPISVISEGMGHDSELTTRIYLASFDDSIIDNANRLIIKDL